ncbi:hypothetical protein MRX96_002050 [Rhipicephalus microplus]
MHQHWGESPLNGPGATARPTRHRPAALTRAGPPRRERRVPYSSATCGTLAPTVAEDLRNTEPPTPAGIG